MDKKKKKAYDPLREKVINLTELRVVISELSKDGYTEISVYDLILYLKGLAKDKE